MNAEAKSITFKKVADRGRPGTTGHAVELEVTVSRRDVFRVFVPLLVAMTLGAEKIDQRHEMATDCE